MIPTSFLFSNSYAPTSIAYRLAKVVPARLLWLQTTRRDGDEEETVLLILEND
jgi:hypothetical protein